ncbi:MAG: hypothetical protein MJ072_06000, partial [Clostridia bacterium]|nr:hypothetical protein [Clostridia bacterium]
GNVIESVKVSALIDVTFSSKIYPVGIENISFESWTIPSDCEFYKENSDVNIDFVEISGISSEIEKIKSVRMKTNAIGTITGDVTSSVSIEALDESGKNAGASLEYKDFAGGALKDGILPGAEEVKTDITVHIKLIKTKEVPIVFEGEYGYFKDITVSPSSVFIKGTPSLIDSTSKLSLEKVNEKEIGSEIIEFNKVFRNLDFAMEGLYEICDKDGKVYEDSVIPECTVKAELCPYVEITVPSENITVIGEENVTPGELKIKVRASEGNESLIVILEDNLKKGKGGVSVLAEVSDKASMKAKVTAIRFSSDFDGKIYEITGDGSYFVSYTK